MTLNYSANPASREVITGRRDELTGCLGVMQHHGREIPPAKEEPVYLLIKAAGPQTSVPTLHVLQMRGTHSGNHLNMRQLFCVTHTCRIALTPRAKAESHLGGSRRTNNATLGTNLLRGVGTYSPAVVRLLLAGWAEVKMKYVLFVQASVPSLYMSTGVTITTL